MRRPSGLGFLLVFGLFLATSARGEQLVLGLDTGYGLPLPGPGKPVTDDMKGAVAVVAQAGFEARWEAVPIERSFAMLKNGPANFCLPALFRTPEREKLGIFTDAYEEMPPAVVVSPAAKAEEIARHGSAAALFADKGLTFIRLAGFSYGPYLDDKIRNSAGRVETIHSNSADIPGMLLNGHGDFTLAWRGRALRVAEAHGYTASDFALTEMPDISDRQPLYFLCSRNITPEILARLNDGIRRHRASQDAAPAQ
jgi:uncharacterized protein (TIGR02285 family)